MSLAQQLTEYVSACFTGLWVQSHEPDEALREIAQVCREHQWALATWDAEQGLQIPGSPTSSDTGGTDPLAAIRSLSAMATPDGSALLVLVGFHRFLNSPEIIQALARQVVTGKQNRTFVLVLAPVVQIPVELEKSFVVLEHDLPSRQQLEEIARGVATEEGELPEGDQLQTVLDAAAGLTRYEAEGAFSLSITREGRVSPEAIWELKTGMLKKSGLVQLYRSTEGFESLGGLKALKTFCKRSLLRTHRDNPSAQPRGVLLLGVPGTGKSAFCKALGKETNRPTLTLDIGSLMGSLVGATEANIRQVLKIADVMAPCILYLDEAEKALGGAASSHVSDSGVSARLFGSLLSWMNDHASDVYLVATCNDISRLPPEFSRAERFDAVVFLDLPGREERGAIWRLYLDRFQLDPQQRLPKDDQWTGAEIKACCRLAALLDVPLVQAAQNVVPVAATAAESVERLRTWASGRCLSADRPGLYVRSGSASGSTRRRVARDPSAN